MVHKNTQNVMFDQRGAVKKIWKEAVSAESNCLARMSALWKDWNPVGPEATRLILG